MTASLSALMAGQAFPVSKTGDSMTGALNAAAALPLASAATMNIGGINSNRINVTGNVTVTAFNTIAAGAIRTLIFSGALVLTHHATALILPTAANIATAAGDTAEFESLGAGNWRCTNYHRASGVPVTGLKTVGGLSIIGVGDLEVGGGGLTLVQAASAAQAVTQGNDYMTHNLTTTFTAPAAATVGDRWAVTVTNDKLDNIVNWNGLKHQGLTDTTMTLDVVRTWNFKYASAAFGWKVD